MQSKFEKYNELPPVLKIETAQGLSNRDLVNLAQTSKYHLKLFKPIIDVPKLLHHVTRGKHDVVKSMLKQDISLIFKRGVVTDCSGREFENISAFEYALWALDKHMWAAMIACIPQNEEGRKVFERLMAQYNKVNTDGVTYRLNGKTITEKRFDFENTIIKELQTQVDSINAPGAKNWEVIDKQWREGVGGAQKRLPMHIVDEYCSNESFYPVPEFTSQPKSPKQFNNWTTDKDENWFSIDSKLSVDFAIYKGLYFCPGRDAAGGLGRGITAELDLDAMTALCKVRTNDFIDLKSQLENQMTPDNHHQVFQL
ncbi:TPA: F-box protein [Legionella pneumophila subsp. pneumophila]|uniref:F-box protein n=1 Tax=Legionella sp. PATHC039 TaxID=2992042 RepID=UPI001A344948|nr:F-box protein [Legionella sp. PATHC039]MCW8394277.1 F-box protein [Legionella sp. PATHC039]HAT8860162.1 F-box protein [Legionella pneumophila subsp. pneumophila]HAT9651903.1 F-box protein [Legionella pneumophila subsp. pneumophila]HAT9921253.1 F-box protein [Legionella pneumophila subsp. pneumophila]